ncbi:gibberellin 2-oxidase [Ramaria rubella]|nr:gibberellin 2-oxidase [Ramaria rubella]
MPGLLEPSTKPIVPTWARPAETKAELDWAPLAIIDLSKYDTPGGKQSLAHELHDAVKRWGFWTVVGTGIDDALILRQLSIAQAFFKLPIVEKRRAPCDFSVGNYFGYREPTRTIGNTDVKENMEMLNIPKFTPDYEHVPQTEFIRLFHDEIQPFHRLVWDQVVKKLMTLFAIILELSEDYFVERHAYDQRSEDHLRYMIYHPRDAEEDRKIKDMWSPGHTDFGSLTLLFSQTVAALQIKTPNNEWKWVRPVPGGITCNAADTLSFMTKGYLKSTIHRVVRPPPDQAHIDRLGLFYFVRPGDAVDMVPTPSPLLKRLGLIKDDEENPPAPVKGYGESRVTNVHDVRQTRHDQGINQEFKVGNLIVQDRYA